MAQKLTVSGRASHFFTTRMPALVKMISRRQAHNFAAADVWDQLTAAYPDFATYQALTDRVLAIAVLTPRPLEPAPAVDSN